MPSQPAGCGCAMGHKHPHGFEGGPGQKMTFRVKAAMNRTCPTCGAAPWQRCIGSRYYSTFQSRPELGRAFFEKKPAQSCRGRFA